MPSVGDGEVLVRVHAASVNSWDWDLLVGKATNRIGALRSPRYPILGADIAGTIEAVGSDVARLRVGDEVFGDISGHSWGGYAEYVSVPQTALAVKSPSLSFEEAASLPQAGILALQSLEYRRLWSRASASSSTVPGEGRGPLPCSWRRWPVPR
jgi:NADPH:quinone reductase-like Zn-dependent oxidoreductase